MRKSPKTGIELEPSWIEGGTPLTRAFFKKLGIMSARDRRRMRAQKEESTDE